MNHYFLKESASQCMVFVFNMSNMIQVVEFLEKYACCGPVNMGKCMVDLMLLRFAELNVFSLFVLLHGTAGFMGKRHAF